MQHCQIVFGLLLIPGGDSTELLQPVDCPLHQIALPVQGPVERTGASFVDFPRDGVANSPPSEIGPNPAAAVPFVAADPLGLDAETATPGGSHRSLSHQLFEHAGLVPLTWGQHECHMMLAGIYVTIACLNDEEWEAAATVLDVDPGTREALLCRLEEIGGTDGLTVALEAGDEGRLTALFDATTGCELKMEGGTEPAPTPEPTGTSISAPPQAKNMVITVAPIPAGILEYDRGDWKHWVDEDGDCQDARQEVLITESLVSVTFETDRACRVETGRWYGAFTGVYTGDPRDLDIDHLVPLKNAHLSGGWRLDAEMREEYANYLEEENHLIAVTAGANRSKGAKGPEEGGPQDLDYWCEYATDWTEVKVRWGLTMTKVEAEIVMDMLGICSDPPDVEVETFDYLEVRTGEHKPTPELQNSVYGSCEEAETAGEQRVQGSRGGGRGFPKAMVPSARDGDGTV